MSRAALQAFFAQLDAHQVVVARVASNLEAEGVHSYARALRASRKNVTDAYDELYRRLGSGGPSAPADTPGDPVKALALALRTTSLLMDDALEVLEDREVRERYAE